MHEIHTFDGKHKEAEKERFLNMVRAHSTLIIPPLPPQICFAIFQKVCHNFSASWGAVKETLLFHERTVDYQAKRDRDGDVVIMDMRHVIAAGA